MSIWQQYGLSPADFGYEPDDGPEEQPRCERCGAYISNRPEVKQSKAARAYACRYIDNCQCKARFGKCCTADGEDSPLATEQITIEEATWACTRCGHVANYDIYEVRPRVKVEEKEIPF